LVRSGVLNVIVWGLWFLRFENREGSSLGGVDSKSAAG